MAGQHHGTHDGDQHQNRSDFKRQQKIVKQKPADGPRRARQGAGGYSLTAGALNQHPADQHAAHQHSGNAKQQRHPAALGALFFSGIQQHDDEDKQHHDGAGVHDHLHRGHELRAQQQVFDRQRRPSPPPAKARC